MKLGEYSVYPIETGYFWLDGGSLYGVIPKVIWQKYCSVDDKNRVKLAARSLLIKGKQNCILIDTGNGLKTTDKFQEIYSLDNSETDLIKSLAKHNVKPEDITDVILTHLHFDHCGGATNRSDGSVVPTFKNARYYVQKKQWLQAINPTERDRASYITKDFLPLKDYNVLELLDGEIELFPNIHILLSYGHTPAMQMIKIVGDGKTLFYPGDLLPFTSHIPLPYIPAFDLQPLVTLADKKKYLKKSVDENWILIFGHDPVTIAGTVMSGEKGFAFGNAVSLE